MTMKLATFLPLALLAPAALGGPMTEAPTHGQVEARLRAQEQNDPMKALQSTDAGDPTEAARPADLLATSDFLCFNGKATLVPKGALLAVPARFRDRLRFQPGASIMTWPQFIAHNRGWISTAGVTLDQAGGKQPLSEELTKRLAETSTVVVATFHGGPISVNPHQPAEAPAGTAQAPTR